MTHTWCCLLRFGVHKPQNIWHLLASATQWKFTSGSPRGPSKSLFFLSYAVAPPSGLGCFFSHPRSLPIRFFALSPCPKMCVVHLCEKKGKLSLKQAGGRHLHCCQQHMHIDSCFVCVGRKTVLVFQCSGRYVLMFLWFEVSQQFSVLLFVFRARIMLYPIQQHINVGWSMHFFI